MTRNAWDEQHNFINMVPGLIPRNFIFEGINLAKKMIWWLPKIVVDQNGWFIMENPIKMDDFRGTPFFRKQPYTFHLDGLV